MPAPDRTTPFRTEAFSLKVPNGIWDHYSAAEIDTIVAGLTAGGGTVDLSAYATTEYVDTALADFAETVPAQSITVHAGTAPQPSAPTPKAVEDAFASYPDGLHYFEGAGSLVAITRQPYQTTVVVNGAARSVARIVKSDAGLPTPENPSTLVQFEADGKAMKLTSPEVNTPFGPPEMVDLFAPGGAAVDLSGLVYASDIEAVKSRVEALENKAAPGGGDLTGYAKTDWVVAWNGANHYTKSESDARYQTLAGMTLYSTKVDVFEYVKDQTSNLATKGEVAAQTLQGVTVNDPALAEFKKGILDEVRMMMSGGKTVPADIDWTPCVRISGTGMIEARVLNGVIQLRGELVYTSTSTGTFSSVQRLPANFPKPPADQVVLAFGIESGVAYRRVFLKFAADGVISIVGDGKITSTTMTGAQAYAY